MRSTNFRCPVDSCGRVYVNESTLKRHVESIHSENSKYVCDICHKRLSSSQNLKEHKYRHTGETPFVCREPGCDFRSKHATLLSAHKRFHRPLTNDISYLKVFLMQLTSLIKPEQSLKSQVAMIEIESEVPVDLPKITFVEQYGPLPRITNLIP